MNYNFDQLAVRDSFGSMKLMETPEAVTLLDGITFCGAEMDFATAPEVIEALQKRALNGLYGYTLADDAYMNSIISWMKRRRGWDVQREWIIPSNGTLHAIGSIIKAFTNTQDGIIIQPPIYMLYERVIKSNNRKVVLNPLQYDEGNYSINWVQLEQVMAEPTNKVMIICNPHNPISKIWSDDVLLHIVELARKHDVLLISDEIFAEIVFNQHKVTPLLQIKGAVECSIVLTSIGKSFNFTGFSHANAIIPSAHIREQYMEQRKADHYGSLNPFIRDAVIAAYGDGEAWFDAMLQYVKGNIDYTVSFFEQYFPDLTISPIEGTYLAWINWKSMNMNDEELERFLIEDAALDVDQGWHFGEGGSSFTRINLATPREELVKALARLRYVKESMSINS